MSRPKLVRLMERYHEFFHLFFGLISLVIAMFIFPEVDPSILLLVAILGSFLPDMDHFLFIFLYGRSSPYAKSIKGMLRTRKFRDSIEFCRVNHKSNTAIISHNIITLVIALIFFVVFISVSHPLLTVFALSWAFHFLFDIIEDFVGLGRLNPNWYLKFGPRHHQ